MLGTEREFKISEHFKGSIPLYESIIFMPLQCIKLTASLQGAWYKLHHGRSVSGNR